MKVIRNIKYLLLSLFLVALCSCTDENRSMRDTIGYVQFKVYKSASYGKQTASRAGANQLDSLYEAKKIKILLSNEQFNFSQTLNLNSYNAENAEYGLRSDKLELQPGEYSIDGYYLYGKTENQLFVGQPSEKTTFSVSEGTLSVQDILVDAVGRGKIKFTLTKNIIPTRSGGNVFPFSRVNRVNLTLQNQDSKEYKYLKDLEVEYKEDFRGTNDGFRTSMGVIDSLISIEPGVYRVTYYELKDKKTFLELNEDVNGDWFTVTDNNQTDVDVPVNLLESADNIKDYAALKAIWEKMNGQDWSYNGQSYPKGVNWSFDDKDIDMWGDQPGVVLNSDGRVASLNLGEFGVKGEIPAEIGQLTELETLMLGTHNDVLGYGSEDKQSALTSLKGELTAEKLAKIRADYMDNFVQQDLREQLSEELQMALELKGLYKRKAGRKGASTKDVHWGDLTNGITKIHPAIGKLKKLKVLYIANAPITELPDVTSGKETEEPGIPGLTALTDLEIYNCPYMVNFPTVIAELPELIQLNMAMNKQLSSTEFNAGLEALAKGSSQEKIQIMYLGYNNISELPSEIKLMKKLGKIDLIHNQLTELPAFGEDVNLVQATFDFNKIHTIHTEDIGGGKHIFCGMDDVESISFSNNKLKILPNIFDVKSIYTMASVSFAFNEIDDDGLIGFEGINTGNLSLAGNKLESFPKQLFSTNSPLTVLNLSGNKIMNFKKGDLKGEKTYMLTTLDLRNNRLTELPSDFDGHTLPYLYGLDLSGNQLKGFPWGAANISYLTVLSLRNQRDNDGNRVYSEWPTNIFKHIGLRGLFLGGNDIGKVPETETISYLINVLDISDNPNIILNVSDVCPYIKAGIYTLIYDVTQDIRGCEALELE